MNGTEEGMSESNAAKLLNVLVVAEKPKVGEAIARSLSNRNYYRDECPEKGKFLWFFGSFQGKRACVTVTSTYGHIYTAEFTPLYRSWIDVYPGELLQSDDNNDVNKIQRDCLLRQDLDMPIRLRNQAERADFIVLFLDCDMDGENIGFEVLQCVKQSMKLGDDPCEWVQSDKVFRAIYSSTNEPEIQRAWRNLVKPNLNKSLAVDVRQELDLRIGCAMTREITLFFQELYWNYDDFNFGPHNPISYGPCQSIALHFCVDRYDQICRFKEKAQQMHWKITVEAELALNQATDCNGQQKKWCPSHLFNLEMEGEKLSNELLARETFDELKDEKFGNIIEIKACNTERKIKPPSALSTYQLLRAVSIVCGLSPIHASNLLEEHYAKGFISYPRTENTKYPADFDYKAVLEHLAATNKIYGPVASKLLQCPTLTHSTGANERDKAPEDHPPITPTTKKCCKCGNKDCFDCNDARQLNTLFEEGEFAYVVKHFLATLMPACRYKTTLIRVQVGRKTFLHRFYIIVERGFTEVFPNEVVCEQFPWFASAIDSDSTLLIESIHCGQQISIKAVNQPMQRSAPNYLTESELIEKMAEKGIGTDGSLPKHIAMICRRKYVQIIKEVDECSGRVKRFLRPTDLGIAFLKGCQAIEKELVDPETRNRLENDLKAIAEGSVDHQMIKVKWLSMLQTQFDNFAGHMKDKVFAGKFNEECLKPIANLGHQFARCGKCHQNTRLFIAKKGGIYDNKKMNKTMYCPVCQENYSLPDAKGTALERILAPKGGAGIFCGKKRCGFEKLVLKLRDKRTLQFCPNCYNDKTKCEKERVDKLSKFVSWKAKAKMIKDKDDGRDKSEKKI